MSEMKLIMERWDKFLVIEALDQCDGGMTLGTYAVAVEVQAAMGDAKKEQALVQKLKDSPLRAKLPTAKKVAQFLTKVGAEGVAGAVGGAAGGPIASALAGGLAGLFVKASQAEDRIAGPYHQFLELFCVDSQTLDLIEDKYQKEYITESDIVTELEAYLAKANENTPLPDVTQHLADWLNTKSDYADADTDVIPKE